MGCYILSAAIGQLGAFARVFLFRRESAMDAGRRLLHLLWLLMRMLQPGGPSLLHGDLPPTDPAGALPRRSSRGLLGRPSVRKLYSCG